MKARREIISTIASLRDETVFARSTIVHRSEFDATTDLLEKFTLAADNRRRTLKAETIIARPLKYSVSHFIDCHAVARRFMHR